MSVASRRTAPSPATSPPAYPGAWPACGRRTSASARSRGPSCSRPPSGWPARGSSSTSTSPPPSASTPHGSRASPPRPRCSCPAAAGPLPAPTRGAPARLPPSPAAAALLLPGGRPPAPGSRWRNPDLAATLERIAERGPAGFYEGETADLIVAEMRRGGGIITHEDLRGYRARWREPIEFTYRGRRVISMPPPSSGGITLALIANILEGYDLGRMGWNSPAA